MVILNIKHEEIEIKNLSSNELTSFLDIRNTCLPFLHDSTKYSIEEASNWFEGKRPDYLSIYVDNKMVGYFRISEINTLEKTCYVGMDLEESARGSGLATVVFELVMYKLYEKYGIEKVFLRVLLSNKRAINFYLKLGFIVCDRDTTIPDLLMYKYIGD